MDVSELKPKPTIREPFRLNRLKYIPESCGCYVLTSFTGIVLYVGLTNNLRRRMREHLEDPHKTQETLNGKAIFFHWVINSEINQIERAWQNTHIQNEGQLPLLNKIYSPTRV